MLENRRELMEKNIAKLSVAVICSLCFSIVGFAHAGSSAKVTDEDKKAVEEVSETQESNKESTADQGNNESKASEEEKNKEHQTDKTVKEELPEQKKEIDKEFKYLKEL